MYTLHEIRKEESLRPYRKAVSTLSMLLIFTVFSAASTMLTFCTDPTAPANAATTTTNISNIFISMLTDMASQLYITIRGVVIPVIIVCVAYAGICAVTGGSKGVDQCVSILKKCFIAVVIVAFAPLIGQQIGNWVANSGTGDLGQYNPLN